jgi:hypothetical protein
MELVLAGLPNNYQANRLYVYGADGGIEPGFPIDGEITRTGDPVVFDSDDDGKLEIIAAWQGLHLINSSGITIWYEPYDGPVFQSIYRPYKVSVDDLDNDGNKEIVVTCYSGGAVFIFDTQGNVRPGWPVLLTRPAGWTPPPIYKSASIGDIDNDGLKEVVVGVDDYTVTDPGRLYCFKPDGSYCPGFPVGVTPSGYRSKAVLADINNDGHFEIIIGKEAPDLRAYYYDGSLVPGYPIAYSMVRGIALGDPYRIGELAIIFNRNMFWGAWGFDAETATLLPNFPFTDPSGLFGFSGSSPNLCDLSDDPGLELATGTVNGNMVGDGRLFAFNLSGAVLSGYPSPILFHRALTTGCSANDVDGNGTTDICCGSLNSESSTSAHSTVYCWDTGYPYNLDNMDWAMDGFDLGHTGRWRRLYHISKSGSQLTVDGCGPESPCYLPPDGSIIPVIVTAVRQSNGQAVSGQDVRYSRTLGCGNYEGPVVDHGDGTYTRMLRAPTVDCTTDLHAWVNEFKLQDCQQIIFTNSCFQPPDAFNLLSPANNAVNQPPTVTLTWPAVGSFPNQATSYDLYFGVSPNPPLKVAGLTTTQYTVSGLAPRTRYYWKVVARNACGETPSVVWCFTTASCTAAPQSFNNISPANGAKGVSLPVTLTWVSAAGATQYEVYLGADPASLALVSTVYKPQATLTGLSFRKTYYWRIIAKNPCGSTSGPLWTFTTQFPFPKPVPTLATAVDGISDQKSAPQWNKGTSPNPGDWRTFFDLLLHATKGGSSVVDNRTGDAVFVPAQK